MGMTSYTQLYSRIKLFHKPNEKDPGTLTNANQDSMECQKGLA